MHNLGLKNLTITNNFGFEFQEKTIFCASDTTANKERKLRKDGHQMALRTMNATKLKAINCGFAKNMKDSAIIECQQPILFNGGIAYIIITVNGKAEMILAGTAIIFLLEWMQIL